MVGEGKEELFNEYRVPVLQDVLVRFSKERERDLLEGTGLHNYGS